MGIKYLVPTLVLTTGHLFSQQSWGTFLGSQMALPEKAPDEKKKIPPLSRTFPNANHMKLGRRRRQKARVSRQARKKVQKRSTPPVEKQILAKRRAGGALEIRGHWRNAGQAERQQKEGRRNMTEKVRVGPRTRDPRERPVAEYGEKRRYGERGSQ